jgi:CubicO group peptidase (beta-lactamase class C family)
MSVRNSTVIKIGILTLATSTLWAQPVAVHEGPRYVEATDLNYGRAIERARALLHVRMDLLPGLSVAVGVNGRIVWAEGFGWADIEQRVPVRPSSKFRVGSVAKPMTAALLALIVEEGKIDLDAPVQRYVPGFPEKQYPITTRQLAGHLGGVRHYRGDEFVSSRYYGTVVEGLEIFQHDPLLSEPGTQYSYSSYGFNLISAVIEGATGKDYLAQMEERVFEPLGMRNTSADQNRFIVMDRARPYVVDEQGRFANAPYVDNSYKWAGGGFVSTAEDLVRFGFAHMKPGFLQPSTLTMLQTSQETRDGKETGYGIGWRVRTDEQGRRVVGHGGGSIGGAATLAVYPDQKLVIAMTTNVSDAPDLLSEAIVELFLK